MSSNEGEKRGPNIADVLMGGGAVGILALLGVGWVLGREWMKTKGWIDEVATVPQDRESEMLMSATYNAQTPTSTVTGVEELAAESPVPGKIFTRRSIYGVNVWCAIENTDKFGYDEHFDPGLPEVSTVWQVIQDAQDQLGMSPTHLVLNYAFTDQPPLVIELGVDRIPLVANKVEVCPYELVTNPNQLPLDH